jgi:hypothetical protein
MGNRFKTLTFDERELGFVPTSRKLEWGLRPSKGSSWAGMGNRFKTLTLDERELEPHAASSWGLEPCSWGLGWDLRHSKGSSWVDIEYMGNRFKTLTVDERECGKRLESHSWAVGVGQLGWHGEGGNRFTTLTFDKRECSKRGNWGSTPL